MVFYQLGYIRIGEKRDNFTYRAFGENCLENDQFCHDLRFAKRSESSSGLGVGSTPSSCGGAGDWSCPARGSGDVAGQIAQRLTLSVLRASLPSGFFDSVVPWGNKKY